MMQSFSWPVRVYYEDSDAAGVNTRSFKPVRIPKPVIEKLVVRPQ